MLEFFLFLVVLRSILLRFVDYLSVVSMIMFPLGDHDVVSRYLLSPSKFVLYLASWCVLSDACFFFLRKYGCFSDYSFIHFLAIIARLSFDNC